MGENCTQKTGQNALKLHLFWAINSKNISKLGWGREDDRNAQYIPLKKTLMRLLCRMHGNVQEIVRIGEMLGEPLQRSVSGRSHSLNTWHMNWWSLLLSLRDIKLKKISIFPLPSFQWKFEILQDLFENIGPGIVESLLHTGKSLNFFSFFLYSLPISFFLPFLFP